MLNSDERIEFLAHARKGIIFRSQDLARITFMTMWTGFATFWTFSAVSMGGWFGAIGLPFVAIGCYGLFGRVVLDAWKRKETVYAVTNERLVIKSGGSITSLPLRNFAQITLKEKKGGRGTITIGNPPAAPMVPWARTGQNVEKGIVLYLVTDAREFYNTLLQAKENAHAGHGKRVRVAAPAADPEVEAEEGADAADPALPQQQQAKR